MSTSQSYLYEGQISGQHPSQPVNLYARAMAELQAQREIASR